MNTEQFDGHTPGPWVAKFDEHGVEGSLVVEGNRDDGAFGSGWEIGCQSPLWVGESDENMPDARLIAAAPELLAEVMRLQSIINKAMQQHTVIDMRMWLFESMCIEPEGQYESGHWEREQE